VTFLRAIAWTLIKWIIHLMFPTIRYISTKELAASLTKSVVEKPCLIDARTLEEYEVSHLLDARLAPSDISDIHELSRWMNNLTNSAFIVTYCSVGYRSAVLARKLQTIGYTEVYNLDGSIFEWVNKGEPVYKGKQVVNQVHPFNQIWSFLLNQEQ
jgi:rhodanese-related sulfurtransferase